MQPPSLLNLVRVYCNADNLQETSVITLPGDKRCEITNITFDMLHEQFSASHIVSIKDIFGRSHYFDGLTAHKLNAFRRPGYVTISNVEIRCAEVHIFRCVGICENIKEYRLESSTQFYLQHAKQFLYDQDFARAQHFFDKLYKLEPDNEELLLSLGEMYYWELGDEDRACNYLERVLDINPDNHYAASLLSELYHGNEMDEAIDCIDDSIAKLSRPWWSSECQIL